MVAAGRRQRVLFALLGALVATPFALAARTGISPLDRSFTVLGNMFTIPSLQTPGVAEGVARFGFFIAIYALLNFAGRATIFKDGRAPDGLSKRTANIIAGVIALFSAFLTPKDVILTNAYGYAMIIWILISAGPAIAAFAAAFLIKKDEHTAGSRVLELIWLLLGFTWTWFMMGTLMGWMTGAFPDMADTIDAVLSWMMLIMIISIIVKLFQALGVGGGPGGDWKWPWGGDKDSTKTTKDADPLTKDERERIERAENDAARNNQKGLDVANPGGVRVIAKDMSGTPLRNVKIHIYPKGYKREYIWRKKDPRMMHVRGITNENGIWPHDGGFAPIGSGVVTVEADLYGWYNVTWFNRGAYMQETHTVIEPNEDLTIPLAFSRRGQKPDFFAPRIHEIARDGDNVLLKGKVEAPNYWRGK